MIIAAVGSSLGAACLLFVLFFALLFALLFVFHWSLISLASDLLAQGKQG